MEGLREKQEPLAFIAEKALEDIVAKVPVKKLLNSIRSIVYPLKDNLRTLDDVVCYKTLVITKKLCMRSDKIAENLVKHYHIILPMFEIVQNKNDPSFGLPISKKKAIFRAGLEEEKGMKLEHLKKRYEKPDLRATV